MLHALHDWLLHVNRRVDSWTASCLPSPPLLTAAGTACVWNTLNDQILLTPQPPNMWAYEPDVSGHQCLVQICPLATPLRRLLRWIV